MSRDVAPMDELAIEGCTLKLRVEGQEAGPVLVLSHMLGTDLTFWDNLVPELGKHFRLVRYDTRGHGGSERGGVPVTLDRLGRDVIAILDALGIERAHFCGESMGGAVGLWLLVHAPARIERAVIAGSAAKLGTPAVWNARIAAALAEGMEQAVAPTLERWFGTDFAERAPEPVAAIRAMLRATAPEGYADGCGALRDMDLREAVRAVPHPVLVLRGAEDPSVAVQDARHLVEAMAGATALEVDARHCASIEAEAAFAAAVVKFLTAKAAPRRTAGARPAKAAPTRTQPSARRVGKSGGGAARRPVARTVPVSGKAVAKASADRKTATRKSAVRATPAPSRRAPAKAATRAAPTVRAKTAAPKVDSPKLAALKTALPKVAGSKPVSFKPDGPKSAAPKSKAAKSATKSAKAAGVPRKAAGRAKAVAGKVAAPVAKASPARRAASPARSPVVRGKPTTAAALRAAVKTKASSKAPSAKAGGGKAGAKIGKGAPKPSKASAGKGAAGPAPAKNASLKTSPRNPPRRTAAPPSKPRVPPGRGRRKP